MMPIWIVMVQDMHRWVDSVWVSEEAARERVEAIKTSMEASGISNYHCWAVASRLEDGVLGTKRNHKSENLGS